MRKAAAGNGEDDGGSFAGSDGFFRLIMLYSYHKHSDDPLFTFILLADIWKDCRASVLLLL